MNSELKKYLENTDIEVFKKILSFNLNVNDEKILILGDKGVGKKIIAPLLSHAYKAAAEELGLNHEMVLQTPRGHGESVDPKIEASLKNLPLNSVIVMNMSERIGSLDSLGLSFRKFCSKRSHRFMSASGFGVLGNEMLKVVLDSYNIDYKALSKKANVIKKILDGANEVHVTTKAGTDLLYNVEGMDARVSDGIYRTPGSGGNIPGTETYIACNKNKVEGTIVVDGSMRTRKGAQLVKTPFEITVREGVVVAMSDTSESKLLEETLRWAHKKAKYPWGVRRIGEFGIGLNPKAKLVGCTVIDEKVYGTGHFAIGSNHWFGGSIYAIIHLDQVFKNPKVKVDGKVLKI